MTTDQQERGGQQHRGVTDEDVARMRSRVGVFVPVHEPYNRQVSSDAIRHFSEGIGDLNPLFNSEEYAGGTRWGGLVASPYFCETTGISRITRIPEEAREAGRGALSGVHGWLSGDELEFFQPIHAGDVLHVVRYISQVEDKRSELAGRAVHYVRRSVWTNQRGQVAAIANTLFIAGGRQKRAGERKKYAEITRASYSPDELAEIESYYDREEIRGAEPRYWEDVAEGDELTPVVKGPLTISDMVAFNLGRGTPYVKAHRRAYEYRKAHPNAYPLDDHGVPDAVERVHWDPELARKTGNPMPYDYGVQRINWLCNLMTHWAGDDGFLRRIRVELRKFNYVGDTTWCEGRVVDRFADGGQWLVRCDISCRDQRGRTTATGWAVVALPSREHGDVVLPVVTERMALGDVHERLLAQLGEERQCAGR